VADRYRKKPIVIEALQLRWDNWSEMCAFVGAGTDYETQPHGEWVYPDGSARLGLVIPTPEGDMLAVENDWIIRGVKDELYPCKPDVFEATYEHVDD
jgi:hypothetical protein